MWCICSCGIQITFLLYMCCSGSICSGSICSCKYEMLMLSVQPVAMRSDLLCIVCSFVMFVVDMCVMVV